MLASSTGRQAVWLKVSHSITFTFIPYSCVISSSPFVSFRLFLFLSSSPFVFLSFRLLSRCHMGDRARRNGMPVCRRNRTPARHLRCFCHRRCWRLENRLAAAMAHLPVAGTGSLHNVVVSPLILYCRHVQWEVISVPPHIG